MNTIIVSAMKEINKTNLAIYFDWTKSGMSHKDALAKLLKSRYRFEPGKITKVQAELLGSNTLRGDVDRTLTQQQIKDDLLDLNWTMYCVETHVDTNSLFAREAEQKFFVIFEELYDSMQARYLPEAKMKMSRELHGFCRKCIYELAIKYNENILNHIEYEECFENVMRSLNVPPAEKEIIFQSILSLTNYRHVPYNKLSPLNQYMVAIPGYVFYCLKNRLTGNKQLIEEAETLMEDPLSPRYLQESLGIPVSKEIKGAFQKPGCGYLFLLLLLGTVSFFVFHLSWWLSLPLGLITTIIVFIIISNLTMRSPKKNLM